METTKQIPIYFDASFMSDSSPVLDAQASNTGVIAHQFKVRAFTKYGNRNGSYITDNVANQLIASAQSGNIPVVGFFDPSTNSWASHSGAALAKGYGYISNFEGWQPFTDSDGVARDYAIFSVVLFTDYFNEVQNVLGQNQSMELDIGSITGDWVEIEGNEYYCYNTAKLAAFCIIGDHEPAFSMSAFFEKNNNDFDFMKMLDELKAEVEEQRKLIDSFEKKGGTQPMGEIEKTVVTAAESEATAVSALDFSQAAEPQTEVEPQAAAPEIPTVPAELFEKAQADLTAAQEQIKVLETEKAQFEAQITELNDTIAQFNTEKKEALCEKYASLIEEEELNPIKEHINDYTLSELENQLAVTFARKQLAVKQQATPDAGKVPIPEPPVSQFALLMEKYKKQ